LRLTCAAGRREAVDLDIHALLALAVEAKASDVHIKAGSPPYLRVDGTLVETDFPRLPPTEVVDIAFSLMEEKQARAFHETNESDFAYSVAGLGRFRANVFKQRGTIGISIRRVLTKKIPSFEELGLPPVLQRLADEARGLVLVTGPTGSGKTTTIAAMLDWINENKRLNIVTIEDPIEILHIDKKCIVHQREIGTDTDSYREALRHITRQDPDVILVGEMRDVETVTSAMNIAMTGHLVLSTFHTQDTTETVNRMIDFFPPTQQKQVRITLTSTMGGIISQILLPRADGNGRVPAVEVMVMNGRLAECLLNEEPTSVMREVIADGEFYGMQTFNQSLVSLYADGLVDFQTAMKASNQPHDFILAAKQMGLPVEETLAIR
jgi:twitching motility protein PilT